MLLVLTMSGCKTRTNIVFNEDGSGTFSSSLEMSTREIKLLSEQGNPIDQLVVNAESVSFPVDVERTDTADGQGFHASFEFADLADMQAKLDELNQQGDSSSTLFKDAEITSDDDGWTFKAQSGGADTGEVSEFLDPEELEKLIDAQIQVTMPGPAGENNATSVERAAESTTFVWDINPGTAIELSAATVFPDSLLERLGGPLVVGGAVVVLAGIAAFVLRRRKARAG